MSMTQKANEQIIGRLDINDVDGILNVPATDPNEVTHAVKNNSDSIFVWDYSLARPPLRKLYEKAKTGQWNGEVDLPWETEVDIEKVIKSDQALIGEGIDRSAYIGTPLEKWGDKESLEFGIEGRRWMLDRKSVV